MSKSKPLITKQCGFYDQHPTVDAYYIPLPKGECVVSACREQLHIWRPSKESNSSGQTIAKTELSGHQRFDVTEDERWLIINWSEDIGGGEIEHWYEFYFLGSLSDAIFKNPAYTIYEKRNGMLECYGYPAVDCFLFEGNADDVDAEKYGYQFELLLHRSNEQSFDFKPEIAQLDNRYTKYFDVENSETNKEHLPHREAGLMEFSSVVGFKDSHVNQQN